MPIKVDGPEVYGVAMSIWNAQDGADHVFEAAWKNDPAFREKWMLTGVSALTCAIWHIENKTGLSPGDK